MDMPDKIWIKRDTETGDWLEVSSGAEDSDVSFTRTDLAQSLADVLERMVNHVAILPPEMDQPGSVMAQARAALANYRKGE